MNVLRPSASRMVMKTAAADVARERIRHGEREPDRDRGIDRIASAFEHGDAGVGREALLRHNHRVF